MTVCVASFAEKSRAIVLVSDKAPTHFGALVSDTDIQKMLPIGKSSWRALVAGDASFAKKVVREASVRIERDKPISEAESMMMKCLTDSYQSIREQTAVERVLTPRLLTKELLIARPSSLLPLPDIYSEDALQALKKLKIECSLLVCGFDKDKKPHMFTVDEPGTATDYDMSGYCAIGSGSGFAIARLLAWDVNRNKSLVEILYRVFDAKAHSEIVNSVGFSWDGYILTARKGWRVRRSVRYALDDLFSEMNRSPFDRSPHTSLARLKKLKTRVTRFASRVMKAIP